MEWSDFSFPDLVQRQWAWWPIGPQFEGDPQTCLMLVPSTEEWSKLPDDVVLESAFRPVKKTKAEVDSMTEKERHEDFIEMEEPRTFAWGVRPPEWSGVHVGILDWSTGETTETFVESKTKD